MTAKKPLLQHKPYFTVAVEARDARFDVRVNGVRVAFGPDGSPAKEEVPVNHWLRPGSNTLELLLYPWPDHEPPAAGATTSDTSCRVSLRGRPLDGEEPTRTILDLGFAVTLPRTSAAGLSTPPAALNDDLLPVSAAEAQASSGTVSESPIDGVENGLRIARDFDLPLPFPVWRFFGGDALPALSEMSDAEFDATSDALYRAIAKIREALDQGALDDVMTHLDERSSELDQAFFRTPGTTRSQLRKSLAEALADDRRKPKQVGPMQAQLEVSPNGLLARLVGASSRQPILAFEYEDGRGTESYDLQFRRADGRWIVTR